MEKYDYTYKGSEGYCHPGTDVLINKRGTGNNQFKIINAL
ncbi:hypothetical protein AGMMS49940_17270 [Spirochaetia bacterium]|nr:hypothetical protein AGMMS49940_17270 [Spirochaetia bacterium]